MIPGQITILTKPEYFGHFVRGGIPLLFTIIWGNSQPAVNLGRDEICPE